MRAFYQMSKLNNNAQEAKQNEIKVELKYNQTTYLKNG